jgi:hypothetical protein
LQLQKIRYGVAVRADSPQWQRDVHRLSSSNKKAEFRATKGDVQLRLDDDQQAMQNKNAGSCSQL